MTGREDLLAHLREEGFDVTQATVSRDIRELQLVKTATADGRYRYVPASASGKVTHSPNRFEMLFRESVLKVDYAGNTVLVKCFSGMANAACGCLTPSSGTMSLVRFLAMTRFYFDAHPESPPLRSVSSCSSTPAAGNQQNDRRIYPMLANLKIENVAVIRKAGGELHPRL